jgi:ferredoxin-thioredoxin reductase catalytic subunit/rubredoxin
MSGDGALERRARETMERLDREARRGGYNLNPDPTMTLPLCEGLVVNAGRYGYPSCPCRLATGVRERDIDIVCPCDYRDADLHDYGACYCGLYVSDDVVAGRKAIVPLPERRPDRRGATAAERPAAPGATAVPVWRCRVCGYLSAAEHPPGRCPICGATGERFEPFAFPAGPPPVWRCQVCGYLAAAEHPPGKCPICSATSDRFERFPPSPPQP